ncbi:putative aminopeptidase [Gluconacetobacter diazotrophicus PA1 5]|uniref:Putative aminopeptidase n=2 Tax=Gluconacetobacter diazotrophicus TaxID=33996 RepID=A9HGV7_GLUDA|nr:putative aminopeptidase [Gluconacetobacter diazotrophicus PA1 5]
MRSMPPHRPRAALVSAMLLAAASPAHAASPWAPIDPGRMSATIRTLASDAFAGRAPATAGEAKTVDWLIAQYRDIGLEPGGENGGWTQSVPLLRTRIGTPARLDATINGAPMALELKKDIYLTTLSPVTRIRVDAAPMVFVGYGVNAPERHWDDYKGVDLKGKVAVFLINDPDFDARPGEAVAGRFGGRTMTYYGRWTYKYEEAARRGAIAALIVHDTPGASYPWTTVIAPGGEAFDIVRQGDANKPVPLQGWLEGDAAHRLFARAGLDLAALRVKARDPDFHPVTLPGTTLTADLPVETATLQSRNVIGKLTGARHPDETVMYGAHWDAFGVGTDAQGRQVIRHGAVDDGSGIAAILEIARAFKAGHRPDRTVLFAAWTAEERGLLGSTWYAAHPLAPLARTAANFTIDVLQTAGPAHNAFIIGAGQDTLQDDLTEAARAQGRVTQPEARPERGAFYRADHLPFAHAGVPVVAIMGMAGPYDLLSGGIPAGAAWLKAYAACYHQPCDTWDLHWDLRGAAEDAALVYQVGRTVAFSHTWPQWKPGSEFAGIRAASAAERSDP